MTDPLDSPDAVDAVDAPSEAVDSPDAADAPSEAVDSPDAVDAPAEAVDSPDAVDAPAEAVDSPDAVDAPAEAPAEAPAAPPSFGVGDRVALVARRPLAINCTVLRIDLTPGECVYGTIAAPVRRPLSVGEPPLALVDFEGHGIGDVDPRDLVYVGPPLPAWF